MKSLIFRRATGADAEAVASLHIESWRAVYRTVMPDWYLDSAITDERLSLWRSRFLPAGVDRRYVLLAESDETLVGFACVLLDEEPRWGACMDNLHVSAKWRGNGIGRQLFGRTAQWVMSTEGGWPIHLWVFESNSGALRFYDALGGEIVERYLKEILKGIAIPSVLYVWHDLEKLLSSLNRRTSGHT